VNTRLRAILELTRPPNVATTVADVLAGASVAGFPSARDLWCLLFASASLYAGGVTLNDVFDRATDAVERPERPIPSGRVAVASAAALGVVLLVVGVGAALLASTRAGVIASAIAAAAVFYDGVGKRSTVAGPINMGVCRGLNFVLGLAAAPGAITGHWPLALIATAYIAGVTLLSRDEVQGGSSRSATAATGLIVVAIGGVIVAAARLSRWAAWPFIAVLAWRVLPHFLRARRSRQAGDIRVAVKTGVLSLSILDAAIAASYAGMMDGLLVVAVAVAAGILARRFAVT
jgi:4-hydroxybenzoate polyprenyltransferase